MCRYQVPAAVGLTFSTPLDHCGSVSVHEVFVAF